MIFALYVYRVIILIVIERTRAGESKKVTHSLDPLGDSRGGQLLQRASTRGGTRFESLF